MAPEPQPQFFGYNAHPYSYPNTSHFQYWQHRNQYHYGQPSQSWQQGWRGPNHSHNSYLSLMQSYPPTYAPYPMPQPSLPQLSQPMPPLPLPPLFRPSQLPAQPLPNPNNKAVQMIHSMNLLSSSRYQTMPVGVNDLQLRSEKVVTSEN